MGNRSEEILKMLEGVRVAPNFFGFGEGNNNFPKPKSNMPGAIDYPDFFYTPEGKFINPMGSSRIMGGTPGRAEEGFGRGKGRKGAEIATLDYSTLSVEDLIDRHGISREQAEKIVEFNKNEMLKKFGGSRGTRTEKNLFEKILPFLGPSFRVAPVGIMEALSKEKAGRGRLQDGGRIGFESGTRDGRTVGMSQNRVTQLLALREEAINKDDRDKIIEIDQELSMMGFRTPKAFGGRIGFQDGRRVQPVEIPGPAQEMEMLMKRLMEEGLSREAAEREAELILFGPSPSAMKLKDSKRGLGSMMASADDEVKDPSDMLTDDAMDMLQTDPFELLKEAIEKGTIAELPESDIYSMYDAAVERGAFDGTFEEFKAMLSQLQRRRRGPEGIMQTMVT